MMKVDAMGTHRLTLVCPAHNEDGSIEPLLREWHAEFTRIGRPFELIIVDDGSTDRTADAVRRMQSELAGIRLLCHGARRGQSAALATGFAAATGDIIVTCDADLQNDPADVRSLLDGLSQADVVCGWRRNRQDTWLRRLVSRCANRILQQLFGQPLHDSGCALRVCHRRVADELLVFDGLHRFFGLVAMIEGFSVAERPVNHRPRGSGVSKYGFSNRALRTLRDLDGLLWYRSRRIARGNPPAREEAGSPRVTEPAVGPAPGTWPETIPMRPAGSTSATRRKSA